MSKFERLKIQRHFVGFIMYLEILKEFIKKMIFVLMLETSLYQILYDFRITRVVKDCFEFCGFT